MSFQDMVVLWVHLLVDMHHQGPKEDKTRARAVIGSLLTPKKTRVSSNNSNRRDLILKHIVVVVVPILGTSMTFIAIGIINIASM